MVAKIAAIQLNSLDNIAHNLKKINQQVQEAKQTGAKLVLLPENAVFMSAVQDASKQIAEPLGANAVEGGVVQSALSDIAKKQCVWLFVGAFPTIEKGVIYQTLLVYDDRGQLIDYYHKRHLFDVTLPDNAESYRESDAFTQGKDIKVVSTPWGRVGLSICYDLRFPEHFRAMIDLGAELLLVPAAFTNETGQAHWEVLLRARAIENQCYVLASGQTGCHPNGRKTWGHSMAINPWGKVIDCLSSGEGFVIADWDKVSMQEQRSLFPVLKHHQMNND
ncbi:MAG: carbon-nitrogen hydrolase family protein [Ostreibacterium sp.]